MTDELVIGMLSGTSMDGVDAVLVNFNNDLYYGGVDEELHAVSSVGASSALGASG